MADTFFDPLTINLRRQIHQLLQKIPQNSSYAAELSNTTSIHELLDTLSGLLAKPQLTELVAISFRPILTDLCARWVEDPDCTEEQLAAIAFLVEPQEELYPILDRILRKEKLKNGPLGVITEDNVDIDMSRLHSLLVAHFRILQANREISNMFLWPLTPLSTIIWSNNIDSAAKLLAIRCYAMQSGMGEAEKENFEREVLGEPFGPDCPLEYGLKLDGEKSVVDGWLLPITERERILKWRNEIPEAVSREGYYVWEGEESRERIDERDLSPLVVNVHGVLLLRSSPSPPDVNPSTLLPTPSATVALRALATHISLRVPTLLTSAPSAGKSLFLAHLASLLHPQTPNQLVTIHLADTSLDARALLGSYISSPTSPGTFEWKDGVLVRAMREGRWVIFEDVDKASSEVLGTIRPLIESMRLGRWIGQRAEIHIPGKGKVVAEDTFRAFATRSLPMPQQGSAEIEAKVPAATFLGAHKFWEVIIQSPTKEELQKILDAKYTKMKGDPARSFIHLWEKVRDLGVAPGGREVGVKELEKLCSRVESLLPSSFRPAFTDGDRMDVDEGDQHMEMDQTPVLPLSVIFTNPTLREDIFIEARDVFFGAGALTVSARAHAGAIAQTVGTMLGLDAERQDWLLTGRTPPFTEEKDTNGRVVAVSAGYTRLMAKHEGKQEMEELAQSLTAQKHPYAMHRPATVLLSRIARAVSLSEPVLLTGETGTGKTSAVTHLAGLLRRKLVSLNLSHQTESGDLIGGFKPVDSRVPAGVLVGQWEELFGATFSRKKNEKFEYEVRKTVKDARWGRLVGLLRESGRLALDRIRNKKDKDHGEREGGELPRKRRKVELGPDGLQISEGMWADFLQEVDKFDVQHVQAKGKFAFGFLEGPLVKALRAGDWILLDEINLAGPETLECITSLLQGPTASITLTEQGSLEPVPRHPEFRLFACMNPATDVGKKDLPPNIRARFTEIDVPPPDGDKDTLLSIVTQYIGNAAVGDKASVMNVVEFYQSVKGLAEQRQIADGANHRPHYSMRTLTRALTFASDIAVRYGFPLRRALWEGGLMAFTMILDKKGAEAVMALAHTHILAGVKNSRSLLAKEPNVPRGRSLEEFIKFGPFYLERGPYPEDLMEEYIITPSVERKLIDLARIVLTRRFPVLIEGPTSSGKTSAVEYLAKRTGHRFVRINNHEHTDIQEYVGSYVSDPLTGKLVFKDGLLVQALRNGDWIVLDELNLAPTDVLEALNRLLDDNRELVIPETQEVVKPHPHFMLFAAQNPPGLYAGRKVLSRAFRNRFLEVHFEDVPQEELETILCQRCRIAPSYGKKIVAVFHELQKRRQTGRVFESRHGFATLRDLFRWAGRDAIGYQELAENGYMLIGERARREDDKLVVKEVIESIMGVKLDEKLLYDLGNPNVADMCAYLGCPVPSTSATGIVWTSAMQRLFILVCRALRFNEPVLLVGETGSGKTSVCQAYADAVKQRLLCLNCHQNTETADLIGGLRPIRNRSAAEAEAFKEVGKVLREVGVEGTEPLFHALAAAVNEVLKLRDLDNESKAKVLGARRRLLHLQAIFEWHDGPLIEAMRNEDVFLLDEISLADDSVLERLNSVLEPSRTIVLAEKGGEDSDQASVKAENRFKLVATMNPGGDYGKKELSPALRNRFTEVWVPPVESRSDCELIVNSLWKDDVLKAFTKPLLDFAEWLCSRVGDRSLSNLRDILAWVAFINSTSAALAEKAVIVDVFHHAAHMTFLDGLGSLPQLSTYSKEAVQKLKSDAQSKLQELVPSTPGGAQTSKVEQDGQNLMRIGPFAIPRGPRATIATIDQTFNLQAPTSQDNAMRILRACQLAKPILLEGSPGVGKTSLITALAKLAGYHLHRINLSDQTDLIDLFGSDLPVEGGGPGEFAWRDAEFLRAMQEGHWVLLDEMNLAPQAVLEGLNAVLDHRGTAYIPELGRSFPRHPSFRIFAAQNPLGQGGGRKGLPKSFVNRFTKVYIEELSPNDLFIVCQQLFPELDTVIIQGMIRFNMRLNEEVCTKRMFGQQGSPWEFNLRDVIRWGYLLRASSPPRHPVNHLRTVYLHRFRTKQDRLLARSLFDQVFDFDSNHLDVHPPWTISPRYAQFGCYVTMRKNLVPHSRPPRILKMGLPILESIGLCISRSWLTILTGQHDSGKTEAVRLLAHFTGNPLQEISINSATDNMDILGSFEQVDHREDILAVIEEILGLLGTEFRTSTKPNTRRLEKRWQSLRRLHAQGLRNQNISVPDFLQSCLNIVQDANESPSRQSLLSELHDLMSRSNISGRFEWVDGPLIRAMKNGHWLLLDNANLCNPSVLDRLNSLCEPEGFLTLSERGFIGEAVQIIKPHPDFRLFMTVDPQFGELSRAMRNRGIEVALAESLAADDFTILLDHLRYPQYTNNHSWKHLGLLFDHARRGFLHQSQSFKPYQGLTSSGRVLDQESALSYVIDQAPAVIKSSLTSTRLADSHLYFVARTTIPCYTTVHWRCLTVEDADLREFQEFLLGKACAALRQSCAMSPVVSSDFALCQPLDFYLTDPSYIEKVPWNDDALHSITLQVLDFAVPLFLHEKDSELWLKQQNGALRPLDQISFDAINRLLESIQDASRSILRSILSNFKEQAGVLRSITKLMDYGRLLRGTIRGTMVDHSALIALAHCILEALDNESPNLIALQQDAQRFNNVVSLSSGLGLLDIWKSLYAGESSYPPKSLIGHIDELATSLDESKEASELRRRTLDYLALITLPDNREMETNKTRVIELGKELQHLLDKHTNRDAVKRENQTNCTLLVVELGLLSFSINDEKLKQFIKEFLDLIVAAGNIPLLHTIPYKQIVWCIEAGKASLPITVHMHLQWFHNVWAFTGRDEKESSGPSILSQPTLLGDVVSLNDWGSRPLSSLSKYTNKINRQARMIVLYCKMNINRSQQLLLLLHRSLCLIAQCFASRLPPGTSDTMDFRMGTAENILYSLQMIVLSMEHSTYQALAQATKRHLRATIDELIDSDRRRVPVVLGKCWAALSFLLFDLLVPNAPVDPAAIENSTFDWLERDAQNLFTQVALHRELEKLLTGNASNPLVSRLLEQLGSMRSRLSQKPQYPVRKDISRLYMYWSEIVQFRTNVLTEVNVLNLFSLFGHGEYDGALQEQVVQESIAGFYRRLDNSYADFADINLPLKLSMLYLRFGLRFAATATQLVGAENLDAYDKLSSALVADPYLADSSAFVTAEALLRDVPAIQYIVLQLAALFLDVSQGIDAATRIHQIDMSYQKALRLWLIDRAKEREKDKEAGSLYRRTATMHNEMNEVELEEQDFLRLFPTFEDVLNQEGTQHSGNKPQSFQHVQPEDMARIADIHINLVGESNSQPLDIYSSVQRSFLECLVQKEFKSLPLMLDDESLSLQLSILHDRLLHLQNSSNVRESYDFYSGTNIPETKAALEAVEALKLRLGSLLHQWPEQMVLHHLQNKCKAFLTLSINSPLAKLLSGLEQLLIQTDDWEMYANKENTLKPHRQALTNIIIEWRRLELSSWRALLDSQTRSCSEETTDWWFRLYEACIYGALNAGEQDLDGQSGALSEYLDRLIPLLDDYMSSSSLGQYQPRLQLLQSFDRYLSVFINDRPQQYRAILGRVQCVLHATVQYFGLYTWNLTNILREQKAGLEKEIQEFIKLASWKDVNVQALKASAQKTHHQLFKVVRKFREVLRKPIRHQLWPELAGDAEAKQLDSDTSCILNRDVPGSCTDEFEANSEVHSPSHKPRLAKYKSLIASRVHPFLCTLSEESADNLAIGIITISRELSSVAIPVGLPPEKYGKQHKALLVRKRKAWSDLLKELKGVGFSPTPKSNVVRNLSDERWIREQPILSDDGPSLSTDRIEKYFSRLRVMMPRLRASLSNHHSDVSTRDLSRGVMLLESGFWMAIDLRRRLAEAIGRLDKLARSHLRLRTLAECPKIVASGSDIVPLVSSVKDALCRLSGALQNMVKGMKIFKTLESQAPLPEALINNAETVMGDTASMRDKLINLAKSVRLTAQPVLLADEYESIVTGCQYIGHIRESLRGWSQEYPQIDYLTRPAIQWIETQDLSPPPFSFPATRSSEHADSLIDSLLIVTQSMLSKCPGQPAVDREQIDRPIIQQYQLVRDFTYLLNLDLISCRVDDMIASSAPGGSALEDMLQRTIPFLDVYLGVAREQMNRHRQLTKALFKLNYVVCSVMLTVSEQGFCKPPEVSEKGAGVEAADASDGVGLGGGMGMEDVSKEIEDESQVGGLKGEDGEGADNSKTNEGGDSIEMSEDIGGDMEDVPDEGTEAEDSKSDEESEGDPEERLGKLDASDPSAVDEKLWGDEKGPDNGEQQDDKINQEHEKGQSGESDVVAKEEGGKKREKDEVENMTGSQEAEQMEDDMEEGQEDPKISGAPLDNHIQEADTLNLPDELDLDDRDTNSLEELADESMEDNGGQDELQEADVEEHRGSDGHELTEDPELEDEGQLGNEVLEQAEQDPREKSPGGEEGVAQADVSAGVGGAQSTQATQGRQEEPSSGLDVHASTDRSEQRENNEDTVEGIEDVEARPTPESTGNQQQTPQQPASAPATGAGAGDTQEGSADSKLERRAEPNPLRSLGDALQEIRQRLDEIVSGEKQESNKKQLGDSSVPSRVEYLHPDEADHNMQALGPAGEEQVAKLDDLKIVDDDMLGSDVLPMDLDDTEQEQHEKLPQPERVPLAMESDMKGLETDLEGAITHDPDLDQQRMVEKPDPSMPKVDAEREGENSKIVETQLKEWQIRGFPEEGGEYLWRSYESLTHDLSYALCEQLRLILEPTLATRLKGDYRTGKRLNMKKIIPYIASDFTKDKIWLRRTRPSQREYQVLIAIDDSRSMAESHSVHLAFQTLALVAKALSRLESGDIAIAKFGETVHMLHNFDEGQFTDQAGTKVISSFRFDQRATNVLSLVETSLKVLETARERRSMSSATAADLWQLEIIISDGLCQDHDRLRTLLRKAEEQRVMVVFIIVDSLHSGAMAGPSSSQNATPNSILNMDRAEYKFVDGRMELQLQKYLDSFPFEYYVVLRNVEALPDVLSGTLKQFFERISES